MLSKVTKTTLSIFTVLFFSASTFAQLAPQAPPTGQQDVNISDKKLKQVAQVFKKVQDVNQNAQNDMMEILNQEGLDVQTFAAIQQNQQTQSDEQVASEEDMKKYDKCTVKLEKIQMQAQEVIQKKITDSGLTLAEYQELGQKIQSNPELMEKVQSYIQQN